MNAAETNPQSTEVARELAGLVQQQFNAATVGQRAWAPTPLHARLRTLRRFRHQLAGQAEALAAQLAGDRPSVEFLSAQVLPLADAVRFLENEASWLLVPRPLGVARRPLWLFGSRGEILREPLGVILVIAPANYPFFLPGVQIIQALAAGNAVLLKPGIGGTRAATLLQNLLVQAGLDRRLLQILPESPEAVNAALQNPVAKVFLTGSARTGAQVLAQLAPKLIPATMELSGCDAVIIRADADLKMAAAAVAFGLRLNDSATCIAPRRVFVNRSVAERFEAELLVAIQHLKSRVLSGPTAEKLAVLFRESRDAGANFLVGGLNDADEVIVPAVVASGGKALPLLNADYFAPVVTLVAVDSDDQAIEAASRCDFALGAAVFSRDEFAAQSVALRLPVGAVVINDMIAPTADPRVTFGGRRRSGFGVTRGADGLLEMTVPKVILKRSGRARPHFEPSRDGDDKMFIAYIEANHGQGLVSRIAAWFRLFANLARAGRKKG